eukprot:476896-Amphidinium_carterae.1
MSSEEQLHCDMERFRKALRLIAMMAPAQVEGCEGAILATRQLEIAEDSAIQLMDTLTFCCLDVS